MLNYSITSTMNISFASSRHILDYKPFVLVTDKVDSFPAKIDNRDY